VPQAASGPQTATTAQSSQVSRNNGEAIGNPAASWQMGAGQPTLIPNPPANQTLTGTANQGLDTIRNQTMPQTGISQSSLHATAEQPPWLPLLLVSLSLMGSLSANLFLGWSYLDARQKYRSLVRKTADTFRRVTTAAA
jgi:hypothetical protein